MYDPEGEAAGRGPMVTREQAQGWLDAHQHRWTVLADDKRTIVNLYARIAELERHLRAVCDEYEACITMFAREGWVDRECFDGHLDALHEAQTALEEGR